MDGWMDTPQTVTTTRAPAVLTTTPSIKMGLLQTQIIEKLQEL